MDEFGESYHQSTQSLVVQAPCAMYIVQGSTEHYPRRNSRFDHEPGQVPRYVLFCAFFLPNTRLRGKYSDVDMLRVYTGTSAHVLIRDLASTKVRQVAV